MTITPATPAERGLVVSGAGSTPPPPAPAVAASPVATLVPFGNERKFIEQHFMRLLGRAPNTVELAYWTGRLRSGIGDAGVEKEMNASLTSKASGAAPPAAAAVGSTPPPPPLSGKPAAAAATPPPAPPPAAPKPATAGPSLGAPAGTTPAPPCTSCGPGKAGGSVVQSQGKGSGGSAAGSTAAPPGVSALKLPSSGGITWGGSGGSIEFPGISILWGERAIWKQHPIIAVIACTVIAIIVVVAMRRRRGR